LGQYSFKFTTTEEWFIQSGLLAYYYGCRRHFADLKILRRDELIRYSDIYPISFKANDWKMLSIFAVWILILIGALFVLIFEYLYVRRRNIYARFRAKIRNFLRTIVILGHYSEKGIMYSSVASLPKISRPRSTTPLT